MSQDRSFKNYTFKDLYNHFFNYPDGKVLFAYTLIAIILRTFIFPQEMHNFYNSNLICAFEVFCKVMGNSKSSRKNKGILRNIIFDTFRI